MNKPKTLAWYVCLAIVGVAAALITVLKAVRRSPSAAPAAASHSAEAPVPEPTVSLPTSPVQISVDELHAEIEAASEDLAMAYPESPEALHAAAMIRFELLQTERAEELWQACLRMAPNHLPARIGLAVLATDRGDDEAAVGVLENALEAGYSAPEIYHRLAIALSQLGRLDEAEKALEQAVTAFPLSGENHLLLGQTRIQQGKIESAEACLRRAATLIPNDPNPHLSLAAVYARLGKTEDAAESRKRFAQLKGSTAPSSEEFQVTFLSALRRIAVTQFGEAGRIHAYQGNATRGEQLLLRALSLAPENQRNLRLLADLYSSTGHPADARVSLRRLVDLAPNNLQVVLELAAASTELGDFGLAESAYIRVLRERPDVVSAYNGLAELELRRGQLQQAQAYAEEGIRWQPTPRGYSLLAQVFDRNGDSPRAEAQRAKARALAVDQ